MLLYKKLLLMTFGTTYVFCPRTCSTGKNCMGLDLVNEEARISWLFFDQYVYCIHKA